MASQRHTGVNRSAGALGLGFNQWTRNDLSLILKHYGVHSELGDSNNALIDKLNQLALERGLTRVDRLAIIKAHKAGLPLPSPKPLIPALIASSTILRPAAVPPAISQSENYSSGASDGSDIEISDSEDADELPSLSDEERDLREYTATMSLPRSSGQGRSPGPRSTASKVANRSLPVIPPAMRNRSATVKSRAPIRRSNLVAANRGGNTSHSRSNRLARPGTTKAAPITKPRSGPPALQNIEAVNRECLICYASFDPAKTLMRQPTSSCVHDVNICKPCLSASISSQLEAKLWTRIGCPASACEEILEYGDIEEFAEPQIFARYFEFTFQAAQAGSHFQRCRTPGCKSGQQCFPEDTIMKCEECDHKTCITCDTEMHCGISCREKAAERESALQSGELATTEYLEKRAKMCPGCSAPTQKTGGCDHVVCKRCGYEYCWSCLADYGPINEEGNEHHAPDCDYHSDNL